MNLTPTQINRLLASHGPYGLAEMIGELKGVTNELAKLKGATAMTLLNRCPVCGASEIICTNSAQVKAYKIQRLGMILTPVIGWIMLLFSKPPKRQMLCKSCKARWEI